MAIALEFQDNIQFVTIDGSLSKPEEAALRLKLDQKYSQGRSLFIFRTDQFRLDLPESVTLLQDLISYLTSIGAWVGISGLNSKQATLFQAVYKRQCAGFATEPEARKWVLEESQKPKEQETKKLTEEDIKKAEIEKLIQSYAPNFQDRDPDPFRISKLAQEYLVNPSPEFIHAIRNLLNETEKIEIEIQKRESELDQSEKLLLDFMSFRKLPATDAEILSHMKMAEAKSSDTEKTLADLKVQVEAKQKRIAEIQAKIESHHNAWLKRIEEATRELNYLKSSQQRAEDEMAKREKEETELLEKLRQGAS